MRVGKVTINNQEFPVVFSTAVAIAVGERTGKTAGEGLGEILAGGKLSDLFWLLSRMIKAGAAYKEINGEPHPEPLSYETLTDLVGIDDYKTVFADMTEAATGGIRPEVIVEGESKNAIASQSE